MSYPQDGQLPNPASDPELATAIAQEMRGALPAGPQADVNGWDGQEPGVIGDAVRFHQSQPNPFQTPPLQGVPGQGSQGPLAAVPQPAHAAPSGPAPAQGAQPPQQPRPDVPYDRLAAATSQRDEARIALDRERKENAKLRQENAEGVYNAKVQRFLDGEGYPSEYDSWAPDQQERWRMQQVLTMRADAPGAVPAAPATPQAPAPVPAHDPSADARLQALELGQRFGTQLHPQQLAAIQEIQRTRSPANDQELLAVAAVAYPHLFSGGPAAGAPPAGAQGMLPGRGATGMPTNPQEPGAADIGAMLPQLVGDRRSSDQAGMALLNAMARENPQGLFTGK